MTDELSHSGPWAVRLSGTQGHQCHSLCPSRALLPNLRAPEVGLHHLQPNSARNRNFQGLLIGTKSHTYFNLLFSI